MFPRENHDAINQLIAQILSEVNQQNIPPENVFYVLDNFFGVNLNAILLEQIEEIPSPPSFDLEKILRNLGADDDDLQAYLCPIGGNLIVDPVKLYSGEMKVTTEDNKVNLIPKWDYFERTALLKELGRQRQNPLNRQPLKTNEPLDAPEFIERKIELTNFFIKQGLGFLGVDLAAMNVLKINDNQQLASAAFQDKLITTIKTAYAKKIDEFKKWRNEFDLFYCPLNPEKIIFDPVKLKGGNSAWIYVDRSSLQQALSTHPHTNPFTQGILRNENIFDAPELTKELWKLLKQKDVELSEESRLLRTNAALKRQKGNLLSCGYDADVPALRKKEHVKILEKLLGEIELVHQNSSYSDANRKPFVQSLIKLADALNEELLAERYRFQNNHEDNNQFDAKLMQTPAGKIVEQTVVLLKKLNRPRERVMNEESYKQTLLEHFRTYENECKKMIGFDFFIKLVFMVCFSGVGFVLGAGIGMGLGIGIGMLTGALSGPGAFVTGAMGAVSGLASGAAYGILAGSALAGFATASLTGYLLFQPKIVAKELNEVVLTGKRFIMS